MKISNNTLKRFIKGACYFETSGGYLSPYKFSKAQIDWFHNEGYDPFWYERTIYTAGIRIEFKTNSDFVSFDYKNMHGAALTSRSNSVDIYIDGVLYSIFRLENAKGNLYANLPSGEKTVTIYLPNDCKFGIKNFTFEGNYKAIKDKGQKVLVIGDSITQGYGPLFSSGSYFNVLQRLTGYNMLNQGIGGLRCEPASLTAVDGFEPDKIITFLGTNWYDAADIYDYENATIEFYKKLTELYPNKEILSISPIWRGDDGLDKKRFDWCIDIVKRELNRYDNIRFVDGFTLMPHVEECCCDKLHPNEYGCLLLAQSIYKEIKKFKF